MNQAYAVRKLGQGRMSLKGWVPHSRQVYLGKAVCNAWICVKNEAGDCILNELANCKGGEDSAVCPQARQVMSLSPNT